VQFCNKHLQHLKAHIYGPSGNVAKLTLFAKPLGMADADRMDYQTW
jgi:hypothetical protein